MTVYKIAITVALAGMFFVCVIGADIRFLLFQGTVAIVCSIMAGKEGA